MLGEDVQGFSMLFDHLIAKGVDPCRQVAGMDHPDLSSLIPLYQDVGAWSETGGLRYDPVKQLEDRDRRAGIGKLVTADAMSFGDLLCCYRSVNTNRLTFLSAALPRLSTRT